MSSDSAADNPSAFQKVFRAPNPWNYAPAPLAIMAATLVLIWIAAPGQAPVVFALLAGIMLIGFGPGLWINSQLRLEVSHSAIVFWGWGYRVRSRWDIPPGYGRRPMGVFTVEALIPCFPGAQFHPLLERALRAAWAGIIRAGLGGHPGWALCRNIVIRTCPTK
jgi:hypothetical protein